MRWNPKKKVSKGKLIIHWKSKRIILSLLYVAIFKIADNGYVIAFCLVSGFLDTLKGQIHRIDKDFNKCVTVCYTKL